MSTFNALPGTSQITPTDSDTYTVVVTSTTQHIQVDPATGAATVVYAGPPGPSTSQGTIEIPPGTYEDFGAVLSHALDSTPHPAYDDMPSLTLHFENGLV